MALFSCLVKLLILTLFTVVQGGAVYANKTQRPKQTLQKSHSSARSFCVLLSPRTKANYEVSLSKTGIVNKDELKEPEPTTEQVKLVQRRSFGINNFHGGGPSWTRRQGKVYQVEGRSQGGYHRALSQKKHREALMNILDLTDSKRKRTLEQLQNDVEIGKNLGSSGNNNDDGDSDEDGYEPEPVKQKKPMSARFGKRGKLARFG